MYGGWFSLVFVLWLWCMFGRGTGISNNGERIDQARTEYQSVGIHQQAAEKYVDAGQVRLGRVTSCVSELQAGTETSAELLEQCQYIISTVRKRGKITQAKN